ncbi:MAG: hypothetical protein ACREV3_06685 [Gammaproteobacteria bacterium]
MNNLYTLFLRQVERHSGRLATGDPKGVMLTFYAPFDGASVVNSNSSYSRVETRFAAYTAFDYR